MYMRDFDGNLYVCMVVCIDRYVYAAWGHTIRLEDTTRDFDGSLFLCMYVFMYVCMYRYVYA